MSDGIVLCFLENSHVSALHMSPSAGADSIPPLTDDVRCAAEDCERCIVVSVMDQAED